MLESKQKRDTLKTETSAGVIFASESTSLSMSPHFTNDSVPIISFHIEMPYHFVKNRQNSTNTAAIPQIQPLPTSGSSFDKSSYTLPLGEGWEGEVVDEILDEGVVKFEVAWAPTLEPGDNLSAEMRGAWESKKAKAAMNRKQGTRTVRTGVQKRKPKSK